MLGAGGWQIFWRVTLPNIRWGLLYGVLLCNARAMGEFGAVSVVSGHIRGETNTMPLHVEILYNEYNFVAAFAVASLLALLALVTLAAKSALEWRFAAEIAAAAASSRGGRDIAIDLDAGRCDCSPVPRSALSVTVVVSLTFRHGRIGHRREHRDLRHQQALRRLSRPRSRVARGAVGRAAGAARPVRLRQDHAAAHHGRPRAPGLRRRAPRMARTPSARARASARSASCSSTTRCSAT